MEALSLFQFMKPANAGIKLHHFFGGMIILDGLKNISPFL
jgi:hypothetical protein